MILRAALGVVSLQVEELHVAAARGRGLGVELKDLTLAALLKLGIQLFHSPPLPAEFIATCRQFCY